MKIRRISAAGAIMLALFGTLGAGGAALWAPPAQANQALRQITFSIKNMTCALCPVTVRTAMQNVKGVDSVKIDFEAKTATVVYDSSVTTPDVIAASSTDAGYPASAIGG